MKNGEYILVLAPEDFYGKKYRDKYCYEHHLIYWYNYGILPKEDEIIHHIDGNKHNNVISNLEIKTRKDHTIEHSLNKGVAMVELTCPCCGDVFVREKRQTFLVKKNTTYTCCSKSCSGSFSNLTKEERENKISLIIIREFKQFNY